MNRPNRVCFFQFWMLYFQRSFIRKSGIIWGWISRFPLKYTYIFCCARRGCCTIPTKDEFWYFHLSNGWMNYDCIITINRLLSSAPVNCYSFNPLFKQFLLWSRQASFLQMHKLLLFSIKISQTVPPHFTKWPPEQKKTTNKRYLLCNLCAEFNQFHTIVPCDVLYQNWLNRPAPVNNMSARAKSREKKKTFGINSLL